MSQKHLFKCAMCGTVFEVESLKELRCPDCASKTLIHKEGRPLKKRYCSSCSGGSCAGCSCG